MDNRKKPHTAEHKQKISKALMGRQLSEQAKKKISKLQKGRKHFAHEGFQKGHIGYWDNRSRKLSEDHKKKLSLARIGKYRGENSPSWKGGISKNVHSTKEPKYKEWRGKVFERDGWKCRINNQDCKGQIQAHHILRWADYPELRYEIKNGITLCLYHHPRKRVDEQRLIPTFRGMVEVI